MNDTDMLKKKQCASLKSKKNKKHSTLKKGIASQNFKSEATHLITNFLSCRNNVQFYCKTF